MVFFYVFAFRWIRLKTSGEKLCPTCKAPASLRQIRTLYAKVITVLDKTREKELEKLLKQAEDANKKLRMEYAYVREELIEQRRLNQKLTIKNAQNTAIKSSENITSRNYKLQLVTNLEVCREGCRVLSCSSKNKLLLVSQKSSVSLFPGYGLRYVNLPDFKFEAFVPIDDKQIRDINFDMEEKIYAVTYMGQTAKLMETRRGSVIQTFSPSQTLWACGFDRVRTNHLYLGASNGSTFLYDIRNQSQCLETYKSPDDHSPIVNICSILPTTDCPYGGFAVCTFNSVWFYEHTAGDTLPGIILTTNGPFVSMNYDPLTNYLLLTTRPNARKQFSLQIVGEIKRFLDGSLLFDTVCTLNGSKTLKIMTRSTQIQIDENSMIAAHLEDTSSLTTWNTKTTKIMHSLQMIPKILDICPIYSKVDVHLAALSDNRLRVYKFMETENL